MIEMLRLSVPLTIWITGFSALYGLQGLTCSRHWPDDLDARTVLLVAGGVAVAIQGIGLAAIRLAPSPSRFVQRAATVLAVAALIAAIWTMLPVLAVSACL